MSKSNPKSSTAVPYAASLLELANERNQAEPVGQELAQIRQIVTGNPSFAAFLADPAIGDKERGEMVSRIFAGSVSPLMNSFLGVLNLKDRLGLLPQISDIYSRLLDEQLGKIDVEVTVAVQLSAEQLEDVRRRIGAALKKDPVVHQHVDDSIIGGLVVRVQDKMIDASVKTQLAAMKQALLAAK
jgi:F-type H+-transporting ATPase subunit delta